MNIHQAYQNLVAKEKALDSLLSLFEENPEKIEISFRFYINGEGRVHEIPRDFHSDIKKRVVSFVGIEIPLLLEEYRDAYADAVKDFAEAVINDSELERVGKNDFSARIEAFKRKISNADETSE